MEKFYLQWNGVNWLTVVLMVAAVCMLGACGVGVFKALTRPELDNG